MWPTPQETEEILNGKLYFFCAVKDKKGDDISKILKTLATEKYIAQSKGFQHKQFWLYSFLYRSHIVSGIIVDYNLKKTEQFTLMLKMSHH